jgi:hypothetical protein
MQKIRDYDDIDKFGGELYLGLNSYLCTYDLHGPVHNAFDAGSIHYEGKWEGVGPWKSRLFWAL